MLATVWLTTPADGTFCNPDTYPGFGGEAPAAYVKGVWTAFPDFSIELVNAGQIRASLLPIIGCCMAQTPFRLQTETRLPSPHYTTGASHHSARGGQDSLGSMLFDKKTVDESFGDAEARRDSVIKSNLAARWKLTFIMKG